MDEKPFDKNSDKLAAYYETKNTTLRNEIVQDNYELVWFIVKRYTSGIATKEDMFQAGVLGLILAVDRFDPSRGVKLSTYAVPYIQNEIRHLIDNPDYIEDHVGLEAVDHSEEDPVRLRLNKLYSSILTPAERTIMEVILRTNDEPAWSVNDIAKRAHISGKQVRELYASGIRKINEPWVRWYIQKIKESI